MQIPLANHRPLASPSQPLLTRRLLPLFIAAFSQGLVLWAPVEKVFLKSLGFDQATLGLMAACYASLIPLLDLTSGILADRWSRKGVLILASVASMLNALLGGSATMCGPTWSAPSSSGPRSPWFRAPTNPSSTTRCLSKSGTVTPLRSVWAR
jgi:MFS family permease